MYIIHDAYNRTKHCAASYFSCQLISPKHTRKCIRYCTTSVSCIIECGPTNHVFTLSSIHYLESSLFILKSGDALLISRRCPWEYYEVCEMSRVIQLRVLIINCACCACMSVGRVEWVGYIMVKLDYKRINHHGSISWPIHMLSYAIRERVSFYITIKKCIKRR